MHIRTSTGIRELKHRVKSNGNTEHKEFYYCRYSEKSPGGGDDFYTWR